MRLVEDVDNEFKERNKKYEIGMILSEANKFELEKSKEIIKNFIDGEFKDTMRAHGLDWSCYSDEELFELQRAIIVIYNELSKYEKQMDLDYVDNNYIPKKKVQEILDKAECMNYYTLPDVIKDLEKVLGVESEEE